MDNFDGVLIDGEHPNGRCPNCDEPTLDGEGESCCGYVEYTCPTCGGSTCDQSC
jgi:hypothetical protein